MDKVTRAALEKVAAAWSDHHSRDRLQRAWPDMYNALMILDLVMESEVQG